MDHMPSDNDAITSVGDLNSIKDLLYGVNHQSIMCVLMRQSPMAGKKAPSCQLR